MPYCKGDESQICPECGALIADGYWPEHTKFHERYAPTEAQLRERDSKQAALLAGMVKVLGFGDGAASEPQGEQV
ncbi:hypothetical protein [Streptomyces sp.]|uniref:hypothetical protein n=1 Tax=Streptomyces sp. TaxID=1931 RepID=UPI002F930E05